MSSPVSIISFNIIFDLFANHFNVPKERNVIKRLYDDYCDINNKKLCLGVLRSGLQCSANIEKNRSFCRFHNPNSKKCMGTKKDGTNCTRTHKDQQLVHSAAEEKQTNTTVSSVPPVKNTQEKRTPNPVFVQEHSMKIPNTKGIPPLKVGRKKIVYTAGPLDDIRVREESQVVQPTPVRRGNGIPAPPVEVDSNQRILEMMNHTDGIYKKAMENAALWDSGELYREKGKVKSKYSKAPPGTIVSPKVAAELIKRIKDTLPPFLTEN
ncbi:unnamed protein product [Cunninghamella blakesleeana]